MGSSRHVSPASTAAGRAAVRRSVTPAGASPDGDDDSSSSSASSDNFGQPAAVAGSASGSDPDSDNDVVDGPATDVEDDSAIATPAGYTLTFIEPFFDPCFPPRIDEAEWDADLDADPWDKAELGHYTLRGTTLDQLKTLFPPPSPWIHPARLGGRLPPFNHRLITVANVKRVYLAKPWRELRLLPDPITFAAGDHAFQELVQVYRVHLSKWAQSYWESTHSLPLRFRTEQYFVDLVADISSRRSRARVNFDRTVLKTLRRLMQNGRCDLDVLLDPIFLTFPLSRQGTMWRPVGPADSLSDISLLRALRILDDDEPWRLFHRRVPQGHPANGANLHRLREKFVEQL
ncbi:hypothetical protein BBJ28_00024344 [Nothophytophthora sp. Chile5]|nr:hypothetical protein BBJ28_00024344 [Nothophytophthora sp. Chile5]